MSGQRAPPPPPPPPSRPNLSPRSTYNPQDYATPLSPGYSPHQYSPQAPPPPPRDQQFRPYNPAAYQDNSIASAANALYGSPAVAQQASAGPSPYQHQYSPSHPQQNPYSPRSPSSQYSGQVSPDPASSSYRNHSYSSSVPQHASRQYSATSPEARQSSSARTTYFQDPPYPQHSSIPGPTQHLPTPPAPPQHNSPSPDFTSRESSAYVRGRESSDGLNITSAFPRPPVPVTPAAPMHESSYSSSSRHSNNSRPLPTVPQGQRAETFFHEDDRAYGRPDSLYEQDQLQQDLFSQVESALNIGSFAPAATPGNESGGDGYTPYDESQGSYFNEYGDEDSDAEAAAGLEAMRMAEKQEHEDIRRRTLAAPLPQANGQHYGEPQGMARSDEPDYEDDDYGAVDLSAFGGGYGMDAPFQGARPSDSLTATHELQNGLNAHLSLNTLNTHTSTSSRRTAVSDNSGSTLHGDARTSTTSLMPSNSLTTPGVRASARVDESGTGGLSDPLPPRRQMSFDADDESRYKSMHDDYPIPQAYYPPPHQPGSRPLPSLPPDGVPYSSPPDTTHFAPQNDAYIAAQQELHLNANQHLDVLPRSQSLGYHSANHQNQTLARAKTDAEERKRLADLRSQSHSQGNFNGFGTADDLDLPALPSGKRLQPSKLPSTIYDRCREAWALSSVTDWLRSVAEGDPELRRAPVEETLVNLFIAKVPTLNIAVAESLAAQAVNEMIAVGALVLEEEWLRFGDESPSGVLFQLTNKGCYAQVVHDREGSGRCYSHHCQRTERKIELSDERDASDSKGWSEFWGLTKEDIESRDKKEQEVQNNLHEVVTAEYKFLSDLNVLRTLYRDGLQKRTDIMSPKTVKSFAQAIFGKLDALQKVNEDFLLPQLKYRQKEQGPWIIGFSDIFRDWIRKAKSAYVDYIANYPSAEFAIRAEASKNLLFQTFLDEMRNHPTANRLDVWHYLKVPITKIQRYSLLLSTVQKNMKQESEEKTNLAIAIAEIQEATRECNTRLAEETRKVDLLDLKAKLNLRPEMKHVELNLTQWGRELIHQGDVQRTGNSRFTWLDTRIILLDNYLVLAKTDSSKDPRANTTYDVSKMPIPMDLLVLESADDDPMVKSTMKGIAVGTATSKANVSQAEPRITRTNTGTPLSASNTLSPTSTTTSANMVTSTSLEPASRDENILYPFRIRHLGKEVYTLFAASSGSRKEWAEKIIEAKTRHAASLFAQNAEPFRLKVVADTAFTYDQALPGQKSITIKGTPLHRAVDEVERQYATAGRPAPVCRARVNCATTFKQPDGRVMTAIGTDYGVYLSEASNARGWTRSIPALRVTQVAVLEEFGLFLLISDKSLIAYHLDVILAGTTSNSDSVKKAPQKLSGAKDVGFFAHGRMKDRTLVFYEKRDGRSSVFKILEPIYKKSTPMAKSRHWGFRGQTDFFRDFDDFYIPTDCTALDLFQNSLSVATARGFEILNLEKKQPWSVPDLKAPHVSTIAARLHGLEPVAMFRLAADGSELLCVYEECAVYVNKYGDVSRSVVMEFVGRARNASLVAGYLVLFDADFVEVRDALNGRLKQVVAGRDVRCLDSGRGLAQTPAGGLAAERSVKFALQHPENERAQIVVELVLNETRRA